MGEFRKTLAALVVAVFVMLLLFILGIYGINKLFEGEPQTIEVNSQTIIERISEQYFVVTKTVYSSQQTTINVDEGSSWSNFFWGKTVEAEAMVRLDVGVDLNDISEEDIEIDDSSQTITIRIPDTSVLDSSIDGNIKVETSQGILRTLFQNDPNADYNAARQNLIDQARDAVLQDEELLEDARNDSISLLELILQDTGYDLIIEDQN